MYCPHCGTKGQSGDAKYCRECGGTLVAGQQQSAGQGAQGNQGSGPTGGGWNASSWAPPFQRPFLATTRIVTQGSSLRPFLVAAGLLLLLPLAAIFIVGALLASVFAGVALIGLAIHLAPVIAICALFYIIMSRRRHMHTGR